MQTTTKATGLFQEDFGQGGAREARLLYPDEPAFGWNIYEVKKLLSWATRRGMSDLILNSGDSAWIRINGLWSSLGFQAFTNEELFGILNMMTRNDAAAAMVISGLDMDFSYEIEEPRKYHYRYRGNATPIAKKWVTGLSLTLRTIPEIPPALGDLEIEKELYEALFPDNGLVLVTGVMGSGKSTLLAAMLRHLAENGQRHISTYEAPIEFDLVHLSGKITPVEQSEVPRHLGTFREAARNLTRRATDVVLIGESRDPETLKSLLEASEIGVAAYTTVHTRSVAATPTRIINVFGEGERQSMAASLLSSLRVIVQQRLFPALNGGRRAVREYLVFDQKIREELLGLSFSQLTPALEEMVKTRGQSLEKAVLREVMAENISSECLRAVLAEKGSRND